MPGSSHSELMPGSLLGKYRIERLLGHGGMATVYLAVQEGTGLEVALKVLMFRGESNRPGGDVARFIREARLAGGIRHPHWVSVYETGYDSKQNLYYIAMERMQASLANRLRAHGPLAEAEAIAVVEQIALALDKAYETQMVHRDIKPANILYNAAGVCKLTDFGIAKSSRNEETQLTLREAVFGTPAYMSPEQAKDARMVDTRSDIYSLGTVFFELLSGERPYQGETPVQVLAQVITDKPPPDVRSKPKARKIHSDTAKLVACMMAKAPAARPQTPADLIARLQKLKAHMPYAKPEESAEEPEYDDSTIMDPTNPPPTDVMLDAGFPSDPGTVRAPTGGAGHTGMWDGAPIGGGNTGGGTGGGVTGTGGGAFGAGVGDEPRTAVSLPTFSVRDGTVGTVGTVGTMGTRFEPAIGRPAAASTGKKGGRKSAAGKVWLAFAVLLLLLLGASFFAASTDFIPNHAGDEGLLGDICRLIYSGPAEPLPTPPAPVNPEPVPSRTAGTPAPEPSVPSVLRFVNRTDRPIWVEAVPGGWQAFEVPEQDSVEKPVARGLNARVSYEPSWGAEEYEKPEPQPAVAPAPGGTNVVELTLVRRKEAPRGEPALLVFTNTLAADIRITPRGEWKTEPIPIPAKGNVRRTFKAGTKIEYVVETPYSDDYESAPFSTNAPAAGETRMVEITLKHKATPSQATATLLFVNPNDTPVQVVTKGGLEASFPVEKKSPVSKEAPPGRETSISYYVRFTDQYAETEANPAVTNATPKAGGTERIVLNLTQRKDDNAVAQAELRFHNPLPRETVSVKVSGGFDGGFEVEPGGTVLRAVRAGVPTTVRFHTPWSNQYGTGETNVTVQAGASVIVDLDLKSVAQVDAPAVLRLRNPNDAAVVVVLSGGRDDEVWVEPGATNDIPVRPGVETALRYYANDRQYAQNSPETAKPGKATPKGGETVSVDLALTKRENPVVQLVNGGDVELTVRVNGKSTTLAARETKPVRVLAGRKVSLEWEAAEEGYLEGGREIGPYDWNKRYRETVVPERRTPPSLRVRNVTPLRGMEVTVTRDSDGSLVEQFTLEKGGERTVELPEAGRYRVRTKAKPDKHNDNEQNPASYDAMDEMVECAWGKPAVLDCTADLKMNPGEGVRRPDSMDLLKNALVSALNTAMVYVEDWGVFGTDGTVAKIQQKLQEAGSIAVADVDVMAGDTVPWTGWASAVVAKRDIRNAEWQRIVAATEASGSWTEFFGRYPVQTRTY